MSVQYKTNVLWDTTLCALELIEDDAITRKAGIAGLVQFGVKIITGAPVATPGKFMKGSQIQNAVDGTWYENQGTVALPVWILNGTAGGGPATPFSSLQYNNAGNFGGTNSTYTPGTHPTQDIFQFGSVGNNGKVITYAENASSRAMKGLNYVGATVQSYEGIFANDQFDSPGLGIKKTRVIYGSNEDLDIEIQGSHAVLISATDDVYGDGFVKLAANAGVHIHPYTSGDTIGVYSAEFSRISEASFGAANTTEVVLRSVGNGNLLPSGTLHLNYGVTDGGIGIVSMSTTEKDAMSGMVEGTIVYDKTLHKLCVYTAQPGGSSTGWETITSVLE